MAKLDPNIAAHLEWIGFVKPTGLVVSAPALVRAGAILNRYDRLGQTLLQQCVEERVFPPSTGLEPHLPSFEIFAKTVLGWSFSPKAFAGTSECSMPDELKVRLPDSTTNLEPHYAIRERDSINPADGYDGPKWQLLVRLVKIGDDFDKISKTVGGIDASPQDLLERLLRETGVLAGLLYNGKALRLVSAPTGEISGRLDFKVADMVQTAGRPISSALRLLLCQSRLLTQPRQNRLAALLGDSRKFQNEVSEHLAVQVLHGLYELLRGFQAAHDASGRALLRTPLEDRPDDVYRALLTVILRIVFLLYAEERDILPHEDETFSRYYSIAGLYERLREDSALYPDTMDQRYGAWSQLLALFRMIHNGAESGELKLPARQGILFDPERYRFLEQVPSEHELETEPQQTPRAKGRRPYIGLAHTETTPPPQHASPLVADGTIYRVLEKLLVLNGERISYRALNVEHIGSVYETMMGFRLERASGRSIAIRASKKHGAPSTINLEELLDETPTGRAKWIQDRTDRKVTPRIRREVCTAKTLDTIHASLDSVVDKNATPDLIPEGAMILQPSPERRRSGSHYTPRELTEPIVRRALEPVLERITGTNGQPPLPEQILELKVCDPAAGSGAFLVEACRQLGSALVSAWRAYGKVRPSSSAEDEINLARRIVARKCLYGVDRNATAIDLARLSLWLLTLSKDQPLTFVDHSIRHGDSLVGLGRQQIEAFHWNVKESHFQAGFESLKVRQSVESIRELRELIQNAPEGTDDAQLREYWTRASRLEEEVRLFGDLVIAAFFEGDQPKSREQIRAQYAVSVVSGTASKFRDKLTQYRFSDPPIVQFHWETEFPEVFDRSNPGFDLIVGNPPFAGKNTLIAGNVPTYLEWLKSIHEESHGNSDLVAHFFRRAFDLTRTGGTFGLIATNTVAQGDTRATGLRWICSDGGVIYHAIRRLKWPGRAAVIVSNVHVMNNESPRCHCLDGQKVKRISAFLFHSGSNEDPLRLKSNKNMSFQGDIIRGMGFTFDDTDTKGVATPVAEMQRLLEADARNAQVILPYIGGKEVNSSPTQTPHRFVIDFNNHPLRRDNLDSTWNNSSRALRERWLKDGIVPEDFPDSVAADWPELLEIIEKKVRPSRTSLPQSSSWNCDFSRRWWQFAVYRVKLHRALEDLDRVLVLPRVTPHLGLTFLSSKMIFSDALYIFPSDSFAIFGILQSRIHEIWARFFGSSLKDDLRYTNTDCFETFPFPCDWQSQTKIACAARTYFEFRASLMIQNDEGMTKTYNRFHDPDERSSHVKRLREFHRNMDRAVLDAYGWSDISTNYDFLLDYEIDEIESPKKKMPYRYRWPDDIRDQILGRLLDLNAQQAAQEDGSVRR